MASNPIPKAKKPAKPRQVNLYEAKTHLSSLVERAAKGEEIVIAKAGKPKAKLVAMPTGHAELNEILPFGKNLMGITYIADDFDEYVPPGFFEENAGDALFRAVEKK